MNRGRTTPATLADSHSARQRIQTTLKTVYTSASQLIDATQQLRLAEISDVDCALLVYRWSPRTATGDSMGIHFLQGEAH
jgi:hypothetical protein